LGSGVFGSPSLSFGDGEQQQYGSRWHVTIGGCRAFPHVGPVLHAMGGLDASLFEQLPNKRGAIGTVII
jgi:hypothetical protein